MCINVLSYLGTATANAECIKVGKEDLKDLLEMYIDLAKEFIHEADIRTADEFNKNYRSVMESLLNLANDCFPKDINNVSSESVVILECILKFLWSLTDKVALVPMFIDIGYAAKALKWIETRMFKHNICTIGSPIFSIVFNLSRHKKGIRELRKQNAFDIVIKCKEYIKNKGSELEHDYGTLLLVLLTSDKEVENNKKRIRKVSKKLYIYSERAANEDDLRAGGYHLSESLALLQRAFSNTSTLESILGKKPKIKKKRIRFFSRLFSSIYGALLDQDADELEKLAAKSLLKILLHISNYEHYRTELAKDDYLCVNIESLAKRPRQDVAKRIRRNLQPQTSNNEENIKESPGVYVSYNWADEKFCKDFVQKLTPKIKIPIWVDYDEVEIWDDLWEYLEPAIQSATVIIVMVSTAYGQSSTNFQELNYAMFTNTLRNNSKQFIVVHAESVFEFNRSWMKEWLNSTGEPILYNESLDKMVEEVKNRIENVESSDITCLPVVNAPSKMCTIM